MYMYIYIYTYLYLPLSLSIYIYIYICIRSDHRCADGDHSLHGQRGRLYVCVSLYYTIL